MFFLYQKYQSHYRDNLKLAVPVLISQLGYTLVQTSDSVIVGHFAGTISLAAVSLAISIFTVPFIIGIGVSYGPTPLIAQHNGRGESTECGKLLSNSLLINLITGIILFGLVWLCSVFLLNHLHQSAGVLERAKPFLMILGLSIVPVLIFNTFKQFAEGLGFTKQAMKISIWDNVLNIVSGVILVKGLFGIHAIGMMGAAYSTLIDRSIMSIVMGIYVFRSKYFKSYLKEFSLKNINWHSCSRILKIGAPVAMQYTFEISAFSAAAILVGTIGARQLAAHQIAISLASMTYMMSSGLSAAAAIKSGNYFGVKDHITLRYSANASYHIVLAFMTITALMFAFGNTLLPWIYTSDKSVIYIAAQLLIIAAIFQVFDGAQVVGLGILRGMSDVNIPTAITFFAYWVIGLPVGYYCGITLNWGISGVWYGLVLGLAVSAILLYIRFKVISKHHRQQQNIIIARD